MTKRQKWALAIAVILLLVFGGIASQIVREKQRSWQYGNPAITLSKGPLYGLTLFLKQQYPDTPQQAWRDWGVLQKQILPEQSNHLLWIADTRNSNPASDQALLQWVAQGNHVVMPFTDTDTDTDTNNDPDAAPAATASAPAASDVTAASQTDGNASAPAANAPSSAAVAASEAAGSETVDAASAASATDTELSAETAQANEESMASDAAEADQAEADAADEIDIDEADNQEQPQWLKKHLGIRLLPPAPNQKPSDKNPPTQSACLAEEAKRGAALARELPARAPNQTEAQPWLRECHSHLNRFRLPEGRELSLLSGQTSGFDASHSRYKILFAGQSPAGSHILRLAYGKGSLTLVNDMGVFHNPQLPTELSNDLNRFDHAYLAAYLAGGKSQIWFINSMAAPEFNPPQPSWLRLLLYAPLLSIIMLTLAALFIWQQAYRLGVVRPLTDKQQRRLSAHLLAQGMFLWRHDARADVLAQLQQQLWQDWKRRIPDWDLLTADERLQAVHKLTAAPISTIQPWLQGIPSPLPMKSWLHYLRSHQTLRNM